LEIIKNILLFSVQNVVNSTQGAVKQDGHPLRREEFGTGGQTMTDRDRLILEEPEKMCESCCNFDKEHLGMDGTALCQLTMTLAYAEDYGGNCMFYNVPKEQIIIPPCKVGDTVYRIAHNKDHSEYKVADLWEVTEIVIYADEIGIIDDSDNYFTNANIGKTVFLTKEEAEQELEKRCNNA
jgi:hypothetical protein